MRCRRVRRFTQNRSTSAGTLTRRGCAACAAWWTTSRTAVTTRADGRAFMDMHARVMLIHPLVWRDQEARDVRALFLKDFVLPARIGVRGSEEGRTQQLRLNVCVYLRPPFDWHDRIDEVLDYDRLRDGILEIVAQGHIRLIETLGGRIVDMCFRHSQVEGVHLQIVKLEAHTDCEVGYETWRRRHYRERTTATAALNRKGRAPRPGRRRQDRRASVTSGPCSGRTS